MIQLSGWGLMAIEWSLLGTAFILILARLDLRFHHKQPGFILRDVLYFCAFGAALGTTSIDTSLWRRGVYEANIDPDLTQWDGSLEDQIDVWKTFWATYFTFYLQLYLIKGTLIALYFELFGKSSPRTRVVLSVLTAYCVVGFLITIFMTLFYCGFGNYWALEDPSRERCETIKVDLAWALHFTSDVGIFILLLVCISRLPMSRPQKISAALTFCLGFVNVSVALARFFVIHAPFAPYASFSFQESLFIIDGHTGLVVAILPSLRLYLRILRVDPLSTRAQASTAGSQARVNRKENPGYQEISKTKAQE